MTKSKFNCSVLVSSCDDYDDLWKPFLKTFKKNWPDCNYKKYFITEKKNLFDKDFVSIKCGLNKNWSDRLHYALSNIDEDYVILMLEDFFLRSRIDNKKIHYFVNHIQKKKLNMIRLIKRPKGTLAVNNHPELMEIEKKNSFRVSTQGSIWNKKILINLIKKNETIWEFEEYGTKRSKSYNNFYCVKKNIMTYKHHVVERGKWFPWYAFYFSVIRNIEIDFKKRKIMTMYETVRWLVNKLFAKFFSKFPALIKRPLKYIAKKINFYGFQ